MEIIEVIQDAVAAAVYSLYGEKVSAESVLINETRKEFEGDFTVVVFPYSKIARKAPPQIGQDIGAFVQEKLDVVKGFNVIKGFLNLEFSDEFWSEFLLQNVDNQQFGKQLNNGKKVLVEFSSPNTNKPLHLGHVRNILLGWSCSKILEAAGYEVVKVQIVNDRGIAICKSMLAWEQWANGATPESTGIKSDHFVGDYYVEFEKQFRVEYEAWQQTESGKEVFQNEAEEKQESTAFFKSYKETYFNKYSKLGADARGMLLKWESGDDETIVLWKKMNNWVYNGFDATYEKMGVSFDKLYYESETYLLGKGLVERGLKEGIFYTKEDGSIWIDLTDSGYDHKVVIRSDGTSLYVTQDLGTAHLRYEDFGVERMVYVVADEQNYHFEVLFETLKRLKEPYAEGLYHLNYGMVDLPSGRMKSREGTVVDADDLIAEVIGEAQKAADERGELAGISKDEQDEIIRKVALAALKYFIIKVTPRKRMTFNPEDSVDMQGQTGPYIQNAVVRVKSVLRKAQSDKIDLSLASDYSELKAQEKELLNGLYKFPAIVLEAAENYAPSDIANYCYDLAKDFHRFYHDVSILRAESDSAKAFRIQLSKMVAYVLETGMDLLGIEMPQRM